MNSNQETFIFKEFVVGLIVVIIFLLLFLTGLRKLGQASFYKNLFRAPKQVVKEEPDYCKSYLMLSGISQGSKFDYSRTLKRVGWQDRNYKFNLSYKNIQKNKIVYEEFSDNNNGVKETVELLCSKEGITTAEPDKLLVSSLLNTYPENLNESTSFEVTSKSGVFIGKGGLQQRQEWQEGFKLKGSFAESYCFSLTADGKSTFTGIEKLKLNDKEFDAYKIESIWEATHSAFMTEPKKTQACLNFSGEFDNEAFVSVKQELWYASGSGLVKRKISPQAISGQVSILPNGYQPVEVTDEIVIK